MAATRPPGTRSHPLPARPPHSAHARRAAFIAAREPRFLHSGAAGRIRLRCRALGVRRGLEGPCRQPVLPPLCRSQPVCLHSARSSWSGVALRFWVWLGLQPERRLQLEKGARAPGQRPLRAPPFLGRPWVSEECGERWGGGCGSRRRGRARRGWGRRGLGCILRLSQVRVAPLPPTMWASWIPVLCLGGYAPLPAPFPSHRARWKLESALALSSLRRCLSAAAAGAGRQRGSR